MTKTVDYEELVRLRTELANAEAEYLKAAGWKQSSAFPDYKWRWCRAIDGCGTIATHAEAAIEMQEAMDVSAPDRQ